MYVKCTLLLCVDLKATVHVLQGFTCPCTTSDVSLLSTGSAAGTEQSISIRATASWPFLGALWALARLPAFAALQPLRYQGGLDHALRVPLAHAPSDHYHRIRLT